MSRGNLDFPPLHNGMDYLTSVVDHLEGDPGAQELKYAVLHLHAAAEVLLKAPLASHDWELVVHPDEPCTKEQYDRGAFRSIGVHQAISLLADELEIDTPSWARRSLNKLSGLRNQLQHFGLTANIEQVESRAASVLHFLLGFVRQHLPELLDEADAAHVDAQMQKLHERTLRLDSLIGKGMERVRRDLGQAAGRALECPRCGQYALTVPDPGVVVTCHFCHVRWQDPEEVAAEYADVVRKLSYRSVVTEGGEPPVHECPDCELHALVLDTVTAADAEEESGQPVCFGCDTTFDSLDECVRCGRMHREDGSDLCAYCWSEILLRET